MLGLCVPAVPVFGDNNVTVRSIWRHAIEKVNAPAACFEHFARFKASEGFVHHAPALHGVIVGLLVQTVKYGNLLPAGKLQQSVQVLDGVGLSHTVADFVVEFAIRMHEVVVRIDEHDREVVCGHVYLWVVLEPNRVMIKKVCRSFKSLKRREVIHGLMVAE